MKVKTKVPPHDNVPVKNDIVLIAISMVVVISTIILLMLYPASSQKLAESMFKGLTSSLGSVVQLLGFGCVIMAILIASSKYGTIKLGEGNPEYSNTSWIFMFICAGLGSATMYWAFMEWAYYYSTPGLNLTPESKESLRTSLSYVFFHWGLTPWSIYGIASLAMAYHFYINKAKGLNLSSLIASITGISEKGPLGKIIDLIFLFSTFGGLVLTTTITVGTVSAGLSSIFGFENNFMLKIILLAIITLTFSLSSYIGIDGGMQKLAKAACGMTLAFGLVVMLLGNTSFIVDNFINNLGLTLTNFVHMSLFTDPIGQGSFNKDWTVFYWLYWITYTPGVSIFITRVSKGRTIRELILGLILGGCAGCWFFFGSLSGFAIDLFNTGVVNAPALLQANEGELAVGQILSQLPLGTFFSLFYFLLMIVFLASHLDATAYTVAAVSSKGLRQGQDPAKGLRIFWCIMLGLIPLAMLYINASLSTLKTAVTLTAAPFIIILIICAIGLMKWLKNHEFK
ncbi:BCCT family transporter [Providencia heimbachae]|uniref:Choline-glycine betaine transporter n=1 Tax=Providencia heimbachae ATCC 35613 TaxID=1354272 RepID=A0A1B7JMI5_9GAMM|nr:BCCT family transporter [Providencia heimbachae]OAT49136.1 choline-glycine betaine transporter [Providencia heimbachae ATCC 35613]QCJ69260.1 BCCT family transporter [Providencia heimbachae]SQH12334.1 L-carnitine/gamma-butyrobetaine antiporter [Providencia heimbachae]